MDGTTDGTNVAIVDSSGNLQAVAVGKTAADSPISTTAPVTIGGRVAGVTGQPTGMSADGDVVNLQLDAQGRIVPNGPVASDVAVTGNPLLIGGRAATTPQTDVNADGDAVFLRMDRHGCAFVQVHESLPAGTNAIGKLSANSGVDIGDVDVTSIVPGTAATSLGKAEDAVHNSGDVGVMALGVANVAHTARAADGDYVPIATDLEGCVLVVGNVAHGVADADPPIKMGGKAATTVPTAVDADDRVNAWFDLNGRQIIGGQVPHDVAASGNPVRIGAYAVTSLPTAVSAADAANLICDVSGKLIVREGPLSPLCAYHEATAAHTDIELVAAPGAGLSIYVSDFEITNDATAAITVKFEEDTASAKTQLGGLKYIPISGGIVTNLRTPIKLTANKNLGFTSTGTSNFAVTVYYYVAP